MLADRSHKRLPRKAADLVNNGPRHPHLRVVLVDLVQAVEHLLQSVLSVGNGFRKVLLLSN